MCNVYERHASAYIIFLTTVSRTLVVNNKIKNQAYKQNLKKLNFKNCRILLL